LFGPQFSSRQRKVTVFGNAMVGVTNTRTFGSTPNATYYEDLIRHNSLSLGVGGGVDFKWKTKISLRLFQFEYVPTRRGGEWVSTYMVSTGIVFNKVRF